MVEANSLIEFTEALSKPILKALDKNPEIKQLSLNQFQIIGSRGNPYDTYAGKADSGKLFIACICRAELPCYHIAQTFLFILSKKRKINLDALREFVIVSLGKDNPDAITNFLKVASITENTETSENKFLATVRQTAETLKF